MGGINVRLFRVHCVRHGLELAEQGHTQDPPAQTVSSLGRALRKEVCFLGRQEISGCRLRVRFRCLVQRDRFGDDLQGSRRQLLSYFSERFYVRPPLPCPGCDRYGRIAHVCNPTEGYVWEPEETGCGSGKCIDGPLVRDGVEALGDVGDRCRNTAG